MSAAISTPEHQSLSKQKGIIGSWSVSTDRHCLDVRPSEAYSKAHLIPSTSIPLSTLQHRFSQLPPRTPPTPFLLLTPENAHFNARPLAQHLLSRGWTVPFVVELPADSNNNDFWEYVNDLGILGTGIQGRELLFRPSPVLEAWITWIEEDRADHGRLQGNVLDVGCGSGRDMGFLVSREYEWYVTGIDNWAKAVERAEVMVKSINPERFRGILNAQVEEISGTMLSLLSCQKESPLSDKDTIQEMCEKRFALVLVIRFFPRDFFRHVHKLVDLGGYLIFSHFTDPPTGEKDYVSPPREKRVGVGEVEELLKEGYDGWEILQGAYSSSEDGRALWDVVARKT